MPYLYATLKSLPPVFIRFPTMNLTIDERPQEDRAINAGLVSGE